jgi:hypothetical protein
MAGASNSDPPNEVVVVTVEPPRESWRRNDELHREARNDASTLGEWLFEEAAWLAAQFLKVAVSVAAFRGIHQLFRSRLANESAYRRFLEALRDARERAEKRRRRQLITHPVQVARRIARHNHALDAALLLGEVADRSRQGPGRIAGGG